MPSLSFFKFQSHSITVMPSKVLFFAVEVAKALRFKKPKKAVRTYCLAPPKYRDFQDNLGQSLRVRVIAYDDIINLLINSKLSPDEKREFLQCSYSFLDKQER